MDIISDERMIAECDYVKAQLLQEALNEKNISCRIIDQNGVTTIMTSGGNMPMVQLFVSDSDFKRASEIVKPLLEEKDEDLTWCPKCGSESITKKTLTNKYGSIWLLVGAFAIIVVGIVLAFLVKLLLGCIFWLVCIFLFYGYFHPDKEVYICNKCGHKFSHM